MVIKRSSFGFALHYLQGRPATITRYLQRFYTPYDWNIIKNFFYQNPVQAKVILNDFVKSNDAKIQIILDIFLTGKSFIIYIVGGRGSGKTCTAFMLSEEIHNRTGRLIYYVGQGVNVEVLPKWCRYKETIQEVPNGCLAIVDESGIQFNAREFSSKGNIDMGKMLMIARHKDISLIFLTQHTALSDTNIQRLRDLVIWKMSNDYTPSEKGTTRSREHKFWKKVRQMMMPRTMKECLFEYPMKKRFIHFSHNVPECWSDKLSKTWRTKEFQKKAEEKDAKEENNIKKFIINPLEIRRV